MFITLLSLTCFCGALSQAFRGRKAMGFLQAWAGSVFCICIVETSSAHTIINLFENYGVHNPHLQNKNKTPHSLPCSAKAAYCARRVLKTCFSFLSIRTLSFRKPCADPAHLLHPCLHRGFHPSRSDSGAGAGSRGLCVSSNLIYLVQNSHKFISVSSPCAFGGNLWLHIP